MIEADKTKGVRVMQAYLLGHTLKRVAQGAGIFWWAVDGGHERFDTMDEAVDWIRNLPRWRQECRKLHQPRCSGRRSRNRIHRPAMPQTAARSTRVPVLV